MAEKTTPFVVNDRRKFTAEGELRHDIDPSATPGTPASPEPKQTPAEPIAFPSSAPELEHEKASGNYHETIAFPASRESANSEPEHPGSEISGSEISDSELEDDRMPPAPTAEQTEQATRAYDATVDRLDTAIRASNPGADRAPEMNLDRFVQSLYMQAIIQLGGAAEPGTTPQVDILGARQTIDMLAILSDKTKGNLTPAEDKLLQSALFEARMGFLEVTQALARQAASRQPGGVQGMPGAPAGGPSIVR